MKFQRSVASLALAALTLLGLVGDSTAGQQVPFQGTLDGTYPRTGTFPFFHLEPICTGEASHLGNFVLSIPHDVNLLAVPAGGKGTFEFIAANGDTLCGTFKTSAVGTDMPGVIHATEVMTITGGTGRFTNATGSFDCDRLVDTINLTTTGSFNGTVSSPGAAK